MNTPRTLARRAEWFDQLATLLEAGVPILRALELQQRSAIAKPWRSQIAALTRRLNQGEPLPAALSKSGSWLSSFDRTLLGAAAESGRIERAFRFLASDDRQRAKLFARLIGGLLYPLAMAHLALLIFPIWQLVDAVINGLIAQFLLAKLHLFGGIYAVVFLIYLAQWLMGRHLRALTEWLTEFVPAVGAAHRCWALNRAAAALDGLLHAGIPVRQAWSQAAAASGSPRIQRAVTRWQRDWDRGGLPSESLQKHRLFRGVFADLYTTGEHSGTLDEALPRIQVYYESEARRYLGIIAVVVPSLVFAGVVLGVAYFVLSFYADYFRMIEF